MRRWVTATCRYTASPRRALPPLIAHLARMPLRLPQEPALGDSWTEEERDRLGLKKRATGLREPGDRPGCVSWMLQIVLYDGTWSHIETVKLPPSATVDDLISGAHGSLALHEKSSLVVTTSPGWLAAVQDALPRETKLGDIDMPPLELPDDLILFRGRKFLFLHEPPLVKTPPACVPVARLTSAVHPPSLALVLHIPNATPPPASSPPPPRAQPSCMLCSSITASRRRFRRHWHRGHCLVGRVQVPCA